MSPLYNQIIKAKSENQKLLAILLDPDKVNLSQITAITQKINQSPATHIFIGGSLVNTNSITEIVVFLKQNTNLPILLFPGNPSQITPEAHGILFLSLLSGRNADYLIEHQVKAVAILKKTNLEIISTAYLLIESGTKTAVEKVSKTKPLCRENINYIVQTAQAAEMLGFKLIYLEAGSGAQLSVPTEAITQVAKQVNLPLIVGGGLKTKQQINQAFAAGANLVVIGTAFENDLDFFETN